MSKKAVNYNKNITALITEHLNKHGEIRGENKKETKNLKNMCNHHKITKKGKIRPTIYNDGNGTCTCEMCGAKFSANLYEKEEVKKNISKVQGMLDQAKFMNQAYDTGKETQGYLAKLAVDLGHFGKTYNKIKKVAEKTDNLKRKKKGNNKSSSGSNYGSWKSWK